jgi:hypothetical protein
VSAKCAYWRCSLAVCWPLKEQTDPIEAFSVCRFLFSANFQFVEIAVEQVSTRFAAGISVQWLRTSAGAFPSVPTDKRVDSSSTNRRSKMAKGRIKLRTVVKRGTQLPTGKGWRLVRHRKGKHKRDIGFKVALLKTFRSADERFAILRIVR